MIDLLATISVSFLPSHRSPFAESRTPSFPTLALRDVALVYVAHVLDHLVAAREPIDAFAGTFATAHNNSSRRRADGAVVANSVVFTVD
nr:hypothetical protein CFP56_50840 [Quercus suber]